MRDLIISSAIVVLLIGGWLYFQGYSSGSIDSMVSDIENDIIPAVESENWQEAADMTGDLKEQWNKYKQSALLLLNTQEINELDYCFAKCEKYIKAKDVSNSSGELNSLQAQMNFLTTREKLSLENIL